MGNVTRKLTRRNLHSLPDLLLRLSALGCWYIKTHPHFDISCEYVSDKICQAVLQSTGFYR